MGIFGSLGWFKSQKKKLMEELELEEQKLKVDLLKEDLKMYNDIKSPSPTLGKPYKKLKLINEVLTIVLGDGSVISKPDATEADFHKARAATEEYQLFAVASSSEGIEEKKAKEAEIAKNKALIQGIGLLEKLEDFKIEDGVVYLKGINRSLPQLLLEKFVEVVDKVQTDLNDLGEDLQGQLKEDEEYLALKRFFMWCCLNPRAEVADKLYDFLVKNSFRITKQGFFVAIRNVVTVEGDNALIKFISNTYNKVKAVWKKKPADYWIHKFDDGEYGFSREKYTEFNDLGNLQDLYLDLPNMAENRFTDDYTKTFDIRIGKVVSMPSEKCSWSTKDCAEAGLHFTADQINYVGCGDTSVLMLINPMKVVGIGEHKGRCYEYLPIMTVSSEESTIILHDLDFDTLELDEEFAISELENLAEKVKEGFAIEAKKHSFNIPQISSEELGSIVASLEDMKVIISQRVVEI